MRILLDECVPRPLRKLLTGHQVLTVAEMGWHSKRNSELLQLMSASGFDVLLTVDQNMRYQQNLKQFRLSIIVIIAISNRLDTLLPLVPKVSAALATIRPGDLVEITGAP